MTQSPQQPEKEKEVQMDSDQIKKTDGGNKVSCFLFVVLLLFNGILMTMLLSTNAKLEEYSKIRVAVPPELKDDIAQKFSQTADDTKTAILATTADTSKQIKENADTKAKETAKQIEDRSVQQLSDLGEQIKASGTATCEAVKALAEAAEGKLTQYIADADKKNTEAVNQIASSVQKQLREQGRVTDSTLDKIREQITTIRTKTDEAARGMADVETKLAQNIVDAEKKNVDAVKQMASSVQKQLQEQRVGTNAKLAEINTATKKSLANQEKLGGELAKLNGNIESVVQENKKTQANADAAITMAKKAVESGNLQLAKIYVLNAISHRQNKFDYLKFYVDMVANDSSATIGELNQVLAIIDGSLYNVPAEDVNKILALREQIGKRKNQIDTQSAAPEINLSEELESVESGKYALKNIINGDNIDADKLQKRIEKINALLGEELTDEWRAKLTRYLQESSNIYSAHLTFKSVINALDKASTHAKKTSLTEKQILSARNQLSTATTLLAQIWTLELPRNIVEKAEEIQKNISDVDERINVLASQNAMKRHDALAKELKDIEDDVKDTAAKDYAKDKTNGNGTLTQYLKDVQRCATELQALKIFDQKGRQQAIETLRRTQELALKISSKRYLAYQLWALDKIEDARQSRDSVGTFKPYKDEKAIEDFKKYLMDIDRGLLSYDVGMCYDKVYHLIFTEQVPTKKQAELQYEKAKSEKMGKLEDF